MLSCLFFLQTIALKTSIIIISIINNIIEKKKVFQKLIWTKEENVIKLLEINIKKILKIKLLILFLFFYNKVIYLFKTINQGIKT